MGYFELEVFREPSRPISYGLLTLLKKLYKSTSIRLQSSYHYGTQVLKNLEPSTSTGWDGIPNVFLSRGL